MGSTIIVVNNKYKWHWRSRVLPQYTKLKESICIKVHGFYSRKWQQLHRGKQTLSLSKRNTRGCQLGAVLKHKFIKKPKGNLHLKRQRKACLTYLQSDDGHPWWYHFQFCSTLALLLPIAIPHGIWAWWGAETVGRTWPVPTIRLQINQTCLHFSFYMWVAHRLFNKLAFYNCA